MLAIPMVGSLVDDFVVPNGFQELISYIDKQMQANGQVNVLIAGSSCSGKTTLANFLEKYYAENYQVAQINQDNYFKNLKDMVRSIEGFYMPDSLFSFHYMEYREDVQKLLDEGQVLIPEYDVSINHRIPKNHLVVRGQLNIFEGLHTIRILDDLPNCIKVFVDTDEAICLERKIQRDMEKYHVSKMRIIAKWEDMVLPMYHRFVKQQKSQADIVIKTKKGE